jgi:hypothetical protein
MTTETTIKLLLAGASTLAGWIIALYFWRFWKKTGDRLFIFFAVAFLLLAFERLGLGFIAGRVESYFYLIRLSAFLLIVYAIVDKNRKTGGNCKNARGFTNN